ncbi:MULTISPECIES: HypC/HybG/HupF family hydrogenase formation chaperone [Amycolatopsis]|uniref:Hydrogenase expression/formation protein HypC n=1 Tax=Amycolatopsis tolypomycina TaxID=208445 RepID=A0A1H4U4S5_9PSEU|nr:MULTISPECIES: HypC/HybG/HupF family hydrogenase formation chaperone [Amycolatopsis]MDS0134673.1 HypC/HybG/HupF family hydrogenase formation chaperone [Amycolatopsis sp. 505]MDS0147428.1 HypC/HybG/HupF family hydrogenase formation chaperone [Amycolatopsis sp. CM201R]SEC63448.1 hydrogenase expression/formation protein HypC [Amycolatopsis tolypomycina]
MCLGVPGRIVALTDGPALLMGTVDFDGVRRPVCLAYTPEAEVGDYVIVHVGFAISQVDEAEAARTLAVLRAIPDALAGELGPEFAS